ncbi:MAG: autotransporter-associated beta strand repeat-containing protein [Kiritimatiellia bacterium]
MAHNGSLLIGRQATLRVRGNATWTQSGGMVVRGVGGYGATFAVNAGGTFRYAGPTTVEINPDPANTGGALLAISGGVFTTGRAFVFGGSTSTGAGTLRISGGGRLVLTADIPDLATGATGGRFELAASGGGEIDTAGFSAAINRPVVNQSGQTGSLIKSGAGTLTLSAVNTYTGTTVVTGGTLLLTGGIASSAATVSGAGTLAGTGVAGALTISSGGTLSPGNSGVGTLATGPLILGAGATARFEVGATCDRVNVTGALTLGGTIQLVDTGSLTSGSYTIITHTGRGGTAAVSPPPGYTARLDTSTAGTVRVVLLANTYETWCRDHFTAAKSSIPPSADRTRRRRGRAPQPGQICTWLCRPRSPRRPASR